jgi:hypothetical protein
VGLQGFIGYFWSSVMCDLVGCFGVFLRIPVTFCFRRLWETSLN